MNVYIRKINCLVLCVSLTFLLVLMPTTKSYAFAVGEKNTISSLAVPTIGVLIGIVSALGVSSVSGISEAYDDKIVKPLSKYLKKYEVSDGVMRAYYKDGKTYVDKSVIQDVADYMNTQNMFTDIRTDTKDLVFNKFLDSSGVMDSESFFMSIPYYAQFKNVLGNSVTHFMPENAIPFYFYTVQRNFTKGFDYKTYKFGYFASSINSDKVKFYSFTPIKHQDKDTFKISFLDENYSLISSVDSGTCFSLIVYDDHVDYNTGMSKERLYLEKPASMYRDYGFRIGLSKQIISEPAYSVADGAIKGQSIDNWDSAWAKNVIDVLNDIKVNTSIDADSVDDADNKDKVIPALPLTLPQYGIDADTQKGALDKTSEIPMETAKTGEVALSPDAIDELSQSIAGAISDVIDTDTQTGDKTVVVPDAKYGALDDYKLTLTGVFPFCIPFDLIDLIKAFDAEPKAPKFKIPLKYPKGYNSWGTYYIEVDLSEFDSVARVVRTLETILFILSLISITRSNMIRG